MPEDKKKPEKKEEPQKDKMDITKEGESKDEGIYFKRESITWANVIIQNNFPACSRPKK